VTPEQSRRLELERALRLLARGREASEVLESLSRRLTNKLLHPPIRALREKGSTSCTSTS
jgi:glutamyl-tRNA reductase